MSDEEYTQEEITQSLMCLAFVAGNRQSAVKELKKMGINVSAPRLRYWAEREHADEYSRIQETYAKTFEVRAANTTLEHMRRLQDLGFMAIEETEKRLKNGHSHDPSKDLINIVNAFEKLVAKHRLMTDRATEVIDTRDAMQEWRTLVQSGILKSIPATEVIELEAPKHSDGADAE